MDDLEESGQRRGLIILAPKQDQLAVELRIRQRHHRQIVVDRIGHHRGQGRHTGADIQLHQHILQRREGTSGRRSDNAVFKILRMHAQVQPIPAKVKLLIPQLINVNARLRLLRGPMPLTAQDAEMLRCDRKTFIGRIHMIPEGEGQANVYRPNVQLMGNLVVAGTAELQLEIRVDLRRLVLKLSQHRHIGGNGGDPQGAHGPPPGGLHPFFELLNVLQQLDALLLHHAPGLGELHRTRAADEQRDTQLVLQRGDLTADGGLAHIELICRSGKIQAVRNHKEALQLFDLHLDVSPLISQKVLYGTFANTLSLKK